MSHHCKQYSSSTIRCTCQPIITQVALGAGMCLMQCMAQREGLAACNLRGNCCLAEQPSQHATPYTGHIKHATEPHVRSIKYHAQPGYAQQQQARSHTPITHIIAVVRPPCTMPGCPHTWVPSLKATTTSVDFGRPMVTPSGRMRVNTLQVAFGFTKHNNLGMR